MKVVIKPLNILYFISLFIAFTASVGNYQVNIYIKYLISIAWCLFFLVHSICNKNKKILNYISRYYLYFLIPFIYIGLLTLVIWIINLDFEFYYLTRLFSSIIYYFLSISLVAVGFYFFRRNNINYIFFAMFFSYLCFSFIPFVLTDNLFALFFSLIRFREYGNTMLEVHDLVLTSGMTLIFFLFFDDKNNRFHFLKIILNVFLIFVGFKRIVFISLILTIIIILIFKRLKYLNLKIYLVTGISVFLCFGFVYIVKSGILNNLVSIYGINTSGRIEMFNFACNYFDFSPFYSGLGYSRFTKMFETLYNNGFTINGHRIAASIHSDALSLYIELGFLGFLILILYITCFRTFLIKKIGNYNIVNLYLYLTIYMIVLLLTDNVFNYFIFQCVYFSLPLNSFDVNHSRY